jgi:tRNA pseudouridine38-40 synthase
LRRYRYQIEENLDVAIMQKAADALVGTHDFSAFKSAGGNAEAEPVKTIESLEVREFAGADSRGRPLAEYEVHVRGKAFLYNMVRIIAGTLVEAGLGKRSPESVAEALASRERSAAGHTAPAAGLWLEKVHFNL